MAIPSDSSFCGRRSEEEASPGHTLPVPHMEWPSHEARAREIEAFRTDAEKRVFLVGLKSGGCGINLQVAKVGILLDAWWNPAPERQAIDRVHRKGSTHADNYFFKFVTKNTDECDRVLEKSKEKEANIEDFEKSVAGTAGTAEPFD